MAMRFLRLPRGGGIMCASRGRAERTDKQKAPLVRRFDVVSPRRSRLSVAAEHVDDFVLDDGADGISRRPQILTGVEVRGIESKVFPDGGGVSRRARRS